MKDRRGKKLYNHQINYIMSIQILKNDFRHKIPKSFQIVCFDEVVYVRRRKSFGLKTVATPDKSGFRQVFTKVFITFGFKRLVEFYQFQRNLWMTRNSPKQTFTELVGGKFLPKSACLEAKSVTSTGSAADFRLIPTLSGVRSLYPQKTGCV